MQKQLQENRENRKEMNLQAVCILPFLQMKAHIYRAKLDGKRTVTDMVKIKVKVKVIYLGKTKSKSNLLG